MRASLLVLLSASLLACSGGGGDTTPIGSHDSGKDAANDTALASDTSSAGDTSVTDSTTPEDSPASDSAMESATDSAPDDTAKPDAPSGAFCGGIAGIECAKGQYCKYPHGECLVVADGAGTCQPLPAGCTKELNPTCGCDGKTYGNPCMAAAAGVSVAKMGACKTDSSCGGKLGGTCGGGEFCDYPEGSMCGATDATGVCEPRPEVCSGLYDPVCGCDGKTYSNACAAHAAGVDDASKGECPK